MGKELLNFNFKNVYSIWGRFTVKQNDQLEFVFSTLLEQTSVQRALDFIEENHKQTVAEQIEITEIPAPPFKEQKRAENYLQRLKQLQLDDVTMDDEGNVYGIRKGLGNGPTLFVSAHLDTVFPEGTDTTVIEKDGILYAPGIGDDTRGLAEVLSLVRAFNESNIETEGDIVFGATVGEEGAGDLRGVKAFFKENKHIDGFISIDGPRSDYIVYLGTGSYRYKVTYDGPGGHSFGDFGLPTATHALGRAIAKISDLQTSSEPRTTFTVGEISGGTSVNAIAAKASMTVDLRSNEQQSLQALEKRLLDVIHEAAQEENERWGSDQLTVDIKKFGDRPSAQQPKDLPIIQAAIGAQKALGRNPKLASASSTDANYPMSLGIPSITLGRGGQGGKSHTLEEWHNPTGGYTAVQNSFLTIISLVGIKGLTKPLLKKH